MRRTSVRSITAAMLALAAGTAAAQTAPAPTATPTPSAPDDVVVTAHLPDAAVLDRFVDNLTRVRHGNQIARWNQGICPRILGLDPAHEAFLRRRLAAVAHMVDVKVERASGCTPNLVVVFTADADLFMRSFIARYPRLFQDRSSGVARLDALKRDLLLPRPIRWLQSSATEGANGGALADDNRIYMASRLSAPTRESFNTLLAIVDAPSLHDLAWGQIADYLALVGFAAPVMKTDYADNTILSMFARRDAGKAGPAGLTHDDTAVLKAMYRTTANANADTARRQIKAAVGAP